MGPPPLISIVRDPSRRDPFGGPAGQLVPARRGSFSPLCGRDRFRPGFLGETTCPVPFGRRVRTGPLFAKARPHRTPTPHRPSLFDLDHAFGGRSSTLTSDLDSLEGCLVLPGNDWSQAAGRTPERLRHMPASVNLPRPSGGQKNPEFLCCLETTRKFFLDLKSSTCGRSGPPPWWTSGGTSMRERTLSHPR